MSMTVTFKISRSESEIIHQIGRRANAALDTDFMTTVMDVTAAHANGCPLRLHDLLAADEFNFAHDIYGINRHINRDTGKFEDCFRPRFARPSHQDTK